MEEGGNLKHLAYLYFVEYMFAFIAVWIERTASLLGQYLKMCHIIPRKRSQSYDGAPADQDLSHNAQNIDSDTCHMMEL